MATNGTISGTPAPGSAGTYTVQLVMGDSTTISTGTDTPHAEVQDFTFVIQTPPTITVNPATLPDSTVGAAYSQALSASGGTAPYTFAVTAEIGRAHV